MKKNLSAYLCFFLISLFLLFNHLKAGTNDKSQDQKPHHEVVVTATRLETPIKETASAITVLNLSSVSPFKSFKPDSVFSLVPGVFYAQAGPQGGAGSLFMRGGNSEHTLFMIDGVEINDPVAPSRSFNFNLFNLTLIDRLEILRGPQSTLYGSDALAGVVNFVTAEPVENHSEIFLSAGTLKTWQGALRLARIEQNLTYALELNSYSTAGVSAASRYYEGNHEPDGFSQQNLAFKIRYQVNPDLTLSWQARALMAEANLDSFGGPYGDDPNFTQKSVFLFQRAEANFFLFDHRWEQKLVFGLEASRRKNRNEPDEQHPGEREQALYHGNFFKVDWQNNIYLSSARVIIFGTEFKEETARSEDYYSSPFWSYESIFPRKKAGLLGFYFQDQWKPVAGLSVTSGIRLDQHKDFGTSFTYRLAASYMLPDSTWKIKATVGTGFKAPSLYQLYAPASSFGPIGNPSLRPEKNLGWDAGIEHELSEYFSTGLTYFENRYQNLIQFYFGSGYQNLGRAMTRGLEASLNFRTESGISGQAGWTWLRALDLETGEKLIRRPGHSGFLNLLFSKQNMLLALELNFIGNRTDYNYSTYPVSKVKLPAHLLTNISFKYELNRRTEALLLINNLFNVRYELIYGYGLPGTTISAGFRLKLS